MSPFLSPLIILLAVFLYGLLHSIVASLSAKAQARRWLGNFADRAYRLFYNLVAVITLLPVLALPALLPDRSLYSIPMPWALLNLGVQALAVLALGIGLLQTGAGGFLGISQLFSSKPAGSNLLVVNGVYKYVRHPLYTAGLVFIWFTPVMTLNLFALFLGLTLYILVGARYEERKLVREFGEAYQAYQRTTPMLIPMPPRGKMGQS